MDADTSDIDAQIAKLQEEKRRKLELAEETQRERDKAAAKVLVGSTPTKKRIRDDDDAEYLRDQNRVAQPDFNLPKVPKQVKQALPSVPAQPAKSTLSSSLASLRRTATSKPVLPRAPRSSSFAERSASSSQSQATAGPSRSIQVEDELEVGEPGRSDDLTILEDLNPGPKEFGRDPEGEETWLHLEPNTKIRLSKRVLPHSQLQEHLSGRYLLPPSLLYSIIRLSKDGATYDVPVSGDWVTIAVVAERGEVRVSGAKEAFSDDEDDDGLDLDGTRTKQGDKPLSKEQLARQKWQKRRGPRKYINLKLCALPPRNRSMGKGEIAGDAMLQLLLFESDAKIHGTEDEKERYRGGSGGAYEKWCNLTVGSVIAVLNPRVLRPLQASGRAPHPLTMPLAINPTSMDAITLIGHARDIGCCSATQKDGKRCRTWVDLRVNQVCEYHLHAAIQRGRSGRAELASATTSFLSTSQSGSWSGGPARPGLSNSKTGLLPRTGARPAPRGIDNGGGGATYVVNGRTVSTGKAGVNVLGNEYLSEKLGRGRATKKKRQLEAAETERALSALLQNDTGFAGGSTGGKYLAVLRKQNAALGTEGKGKDKADEPGADGLTSPAEMDKERKRVFDADAIKRIGFDPTARRGQRNEEETKKRLAAIASLREHPDRPLKLTRPKDLSRSNVRVPPQATSSAPSRNDDSHDNDEDQDMIDLD